MHPDAKVVVDREGVAPEVVSFSETTALEPALCDNCQRRRLKFEEHLAAQGLVECRLKDIDAGVVLQAFDSFCRNKRVETPFLVEAVIGVATTAWPFQFDPHHIARCEGFVQAGVAESVSE